MKRTTRRNSRDAGALKRLLEPYSLDSLLQNDLSKSSRIIRGWPTKFNKLFSWTVLNRTLATQRLQPPRLRVAMESKSGIDTYEAFERIMTRSGDRYYRLDTEPFNRLLAKGATLVLNAVNEMHPPLQRLCEGFARIFLVDPQVNVYASWGHAESFGVHWDDHDVFVLQIAGTKNWKIYGPSRLSPLHRDGDLTERPSSRPLRTLRLGAGDLLYIPRGHWHTAVSPDSPSLHLSLGVSALTGVDYYSWLVEQARQDLRARQDLPLSTDTAALADSHARLADILHKTALRYAPRDFLAFNRSLLNRTPSPAFPFGVSRLHLPTLDQRVQLAGPLAPNVTATSKAAIVNDQGRRYSFDPGSAAVLRVLLNGSVHSVRHIVRRHSSTMRSTELLPMINKLLAKGLLRLSESRA